MDPYVHAYLSSRKMSGLISPIFRGMVHYAGQELLGPYSRVDPMSYGTHHKIISLSSRARGTTCILEGTSEGMLEGDSDGDSEGMLEGTSEGMLEGTSEGDSDGILEGDSDGDSEGMLEGTSEGMLE
eukprot:scaffold106061_cov29-Attheya_sp.AAC.1